MEQYYLIKDGKYDKKAIIHRAWCYKKSPTNTTFHNSFERALEQAWVDARLEMDVYKARLKPRPLRSGYDYGYNILKATFLGNHPDNICYDSSWREP